MVAIGSQNEGWQNGPDLWQGMSTAGDLVDSFVPSGGGIKSLSQVMRWGLGNVVGTKPFIGVGSSGFSGPTGFRNELIQGGQNTHVGRHVAVSAALVLNGMSLGIDLGTAIDRAQNKGDETIAEILGNEAGRQVGNAFKDFHKENINSNQLKERLMEQLCE